MTATSLVVFFLIENRRADRGHTVIEKLESFRYTI